MLWLCAFVANLALIDDVPYLLLLIAQTVLFVAGAIGFLLQGSRRGLGLFGRPYYFLLTNVASLIATLRYLQGERMVTWKPLR